MQRNKNRNPPADLSDPGEVAIRLKRIRTRRRYSQQHVCDLSGVNFHTYRSIESGMHTSNYLTLARICRALETSLDEVVGIADPGAHEICEKIRLLPQRERRTIEHMLDQSHELVRIRRGEIRPDIVSWIGRPVDAIAQEAS